MVEICPPGSAMNQQPSLLSVLDPKSRERLIQALARLFHTEESRQQHQQRERRVLD